MPNRELDTAYYALSRRMARVERQATRMASHQTWTGRTAQQVGATLGITNIPAANTGNLWANAIAEPTRLLVQPINLAPGKWFAEFSSTAFFSGSAASATYWVNFGLYDATLPSVIWLGSLVTQINDASGNPIFRDRNVRLSQIIDLTSTYNLDIIAEGFGSSGSGFFSSAFANQQQNHRLIAIPV